MTTTDTTSELVTAEDFLPDGTLRALNRLQHGFMPGSFGRTPYWTPKPPPCWRQVHEPNWAWRHPDHGQIDMVPLDCNGAFLAPLSGTEFARDALVQTGAISTPAVNQVLPGYYLINSAPWSDPRIVSPLGQAPMPAQVWVAAPTLQLLLELVASGSWLDITVFDSWTCDAKCRMSAWADWLKRVRILAMDTDERDQRDYPGIKPGQAAQMVKDGYSMAVQLIGHIPEKGKPVKSGVQRPDWHHAIRCQHKANVWRKCWNAVQAGLPILYMGDTDAIDIPAWGLPWLQEHAPGMRHKPPQIDLTGRRLGHFKIRKEKDA